MQDFKLAQGEIVIPLTGTREILVFASAKTELILSGLLGRTPIPLESGKNIRFKGRLDEKFDQVKIQSHGKSPFGYSFQERQVTEPVLNDEEPPAVSLDTPDNLVAKINRVFAQERQTGLGTLEPDEDLPFHQRYYVDDEDWEFEEEIYAQSDPSMQKRNEGEATGEAGHPVNFTVGTDDNALTDVTEQKRNADPPPEDNTALAAE